MYVLLVIVSVYGMRWNGMRLYWMIAHIHVYTHKPHHETLNSINLPLKATGERCFALKPSSDIAAGWDLSYLCVCVGVRVGVGVCVHECVGVCVCM